MAVETVQYNPHERTWRRILILIDPEGGRYVREVENIYLPDNYEVDKTVRPVVD